MMCRMNLGLIGREVSCKGNKVALCSKILLMRTVKR